MNCFAFCSTLSASVSDFHPPSTTAGPRSLSSPPGPCSFQALCTGEPVCSRASKRLTMFSLSLSPSLSLSLALSFLFFFYRLHPPSKIQESGRAPQPAQAVPSRFAQPPEVRRRKRCILEGAEQSGGKLSPDQVRADYKKGSVYIDGVKVAGCGGQPERGEVRVADYGRIDAEAVCAHTKETT